MDFIATVLRPPLFPRNQERYDVLLNNIGCVVYLNLVLKNVINPWQMAFLLRKDFKVFDITPIVMWIEC